MSQKEWIEQFIKETSDKWTKTSDFLWGHPELRFEEYESVKHLTAVLRDEGFIVEENIANIETAFVAEYGSGSPVIRSEEHTSELQSRGQLVCRLLLEKNKSLNSHLLFSW